MSDQFLNDGGPSPGLFLTIEGVGDRVVEADQRATVRDLTVALGGKRLSVLVVQRSGRSLLPSAPLRFSDLRCGDTVRLEATFDAETVDVAVGDLVLVILTGPNTGSKIALHLGENRLGRAADNDVVLTDPGVSRYHATITVDDSMVSVADSGSTNGVLVGEEIIPGPTVLRSGQQLLIGQVWLEVHFETAAMEARRWDSGDSEFRPVQVSPGTRPHKSYLGERVSFPAAPSRGRGWRRATGDGFEAAVNLYDRSLQTANAALVKEIDAEWSARLGEAPAATEIAEAVSHDQSRLWPRAANDPLLTRVGLATLPSRINCHVPAEGEPELQAKAEAIVAQHRTVEGVPATVDFLASHSVLVAGDEQNSRQLAYSLLGQLTAQHSPQRLRLWGLLSPDHVAEWDWLKWLPHCGGFTSDGEFSQVTADPEKYGDVVRRLVSAVNRAADAAMIDQPAAIVLIDGRATVANELQSMIEAMTAQHGVRVTALVVGPSEVRHQLELPFGERGSVVMVENDYASMETIGSRSVDAVLGIEYETFSLGDIEALAKVMTCAEPESEQSVMFWAADGSASRQTDLDGLIRGADPAIVIEQWADQSEPGRLVAPLGSNENGPVRVDLRELGPHALVSGDLDGFLPAWVSALATNYSPTKLNFYLIDSTGGSVFRNCRDLPHTIGSLYDTSLLQIKSALAMLSAEMDRREAVLSSLDSGTIEGLERQGRSSPFPYLVIAVDQVGRLGANPSANRGSDDIVSLDPTSDLLAIADRGQQLGVHLLLGSTSNPRLAEHIALRVHAGRSGSSTLTVGRAPVLSFVATMASPRPEILVKTFALDDVSEINRSPLPVVEHDDLERLTTLIRNAHEYSGDPLPSALG